MLMPHIRIFVSQHEALHADVECLPYADYFDTRHYSKNAQHRMPRSVCHFENGAAMPLRPLWGDPRRLRGRRLRLGGRGQRRRLGSHVAQAARCRWGECESFVRVISRCRSEFEQSRSRRSSSFGWRACRTTRWCCEWCCCCSTTTLCSTTRSTRTVPSRCAHMYCVAHAL